MLIAVSGLPGTGKTYFATRLAAALDWLHFNTDQVRTKLGLRGDYAPEIKQQVYDHLFDRAFAALEDHRGVVIDATFSEQHYRDQLTLQATKGGYAVNFIEMTAEDETIRQRVSEDREDSEAGLAVYQKIKETYDPILKPHLTFNSTHQSVEEMIERTIDYFSL